QNGNWYVPSVVRSQVNQIVSTIGTNTVVYNSGSGTFIVPPGVYILREIESTGGGGGGGGGGPSGGGGNGGCPVKGPLNVPPGEAIGYSVGAPGAVGPLASNAGDGGAS